MGALACLVLAGPAQADEALRLNCGGVGLDESEGMRAEAGKHALTLLLTTPDGDYLGDVHLRVEDPLKNRQAEANCGPIGQVDVSEAGRYRVVASYKGKSQSQWFNLKPGGGARATLRWSE